MHGDICDATLVASLFADHRLDAVVHFAAESHVDRSILSPHQAIDTNVRGTATLLDAARAARISRFLLVSTDEVYGDIDEPFEADESFPLKPSSPYAASKASADLLALAYVSTFKLPVLITRASNNYGPYQFPEKLIPLMISNALDGVPLPVYGDGLQVRDWLYVDDHCRALLAVLERGRDGEVYNVAGACHLPNIEVINRLLKIVGAPEQLITTVADRPGHDRRYALRGDKIARDTGFVPEVELRERPGTDGSVVSGQRGVDGSRQVRCVSRLLPEELRVARDKGNCRGHQRTWERSSRGVRDMSRSDRCPPRGEGERQVARKCQVSWQFQSGKETRLDDFDAVEFSARGRGYFRMEIDVERVLGRVEPVLVLVQPHAQKADRPDR